MARALLLERLNHNGIIMRTSRISGFVDQQRGFTLTELVVVFGVLAIFLLLLFAGFPRVGAKSQRVHCAATLKNLGLATRVSTVPAARLSGTITWTTAAEYVKS